MGKAKAVPATPISIPDSLSHSSNPSPDSMTQPLTSTSSEEDPTILVDDDSDLSSERIPQSKGKGKAAAASKSVKAKGDKGGKKRKADDGNDEKAKPKKQRQGQGWVTLQLDADDGKGGKVPLCHQCNQKQKPDNVLRCTRARRYGKVIKSCDIAFCFKDLKTKYGIDPEEVMKRGREDEFMYRELHNPDSKYIWCCPFCEDECLCSICRKMNGLPPIGGALPSETRRSKNYVKAELLSSEDGVSDSDIEELPAKKGKQSVPKPFDSGSDLSEIVESVEKGKKAPAAKKPEQKKAKISSGDQPSKSVKKAPKAAPKKTAGKEAGKVTPKKATKAAIGSKKSSGPPKPKATPVKRVEVPVEPPNFDKVDTKLSLEEAEHRIQLREYVTRFRGVLSIPERSLTALDDFDRSLTDASVRLFAGAMLDIIRDEVGSSGIEDLVDILSQHREELRYYADLARFVTIYNIISPLLKLRLPSLTPIQTRPANANTAAIRALLDLDENSPAPSWAELPSGPSRRVGASRLPQPIEVIRMLLALAERTLPTLKIRAELDASTGEFELRRKHGSQQKAEVAKFEGSRKKLMEAGVKAKSAAETRANKEALKKERYEHEMRMSLLNVNLRASLGRRSLRHEALGADLDGRIYYALSIRTIDDDGRPPIGWASGLLVYGMGVPPKTDTEFDPEALPINLPRWSHFGKSTNVKQLIKWIEYTFKKAITAAKPAKGATPRKTPNGKAGPGLNGTSKKGTPIQTTLSYQPTPTKSANRTPRETFEVLIPTTAKRLKAFSSDSTLSSVSGDKDGNGKRAESDDDSVLSSVPESETPDFSDLLPPIGYKPSALTIEEQGKDLVRRLREVCEWLEVLEWKGLGEVY